MWIKFHQAKSASCSTLPCFAFSCSGFCTARAARAEGDVRVNSNYISSLLRALERGDGMCWGCSSVPKAEKYLCVASSEHVYLAGGRGYDLKAWTRRVKSSPSGPNGALSSTSPHSQAWCEVRAARRQQWWQIWPVSLGCICGGTWATLAPTPPWGHGPVFWGQLGGCHDWAGLWGTGDRPCFSIRAGTDGLSCHVCGCAQHRATAVPNAGLGRVTIMGS